MWSRIRDDPSRIDCHSKPREKLVNLKSNTGGSPWFPPKYVVAWYANVTHEIDSFLCDKLDYPDMNEMLF